MFKWTKHRQEDPGKSLNGHPTDTHAHFWNDLVSVNRCKYYEEMDASLVGAPVFKTVCAALILPQVGSIPTHLRHPSKNP